MNNYWLKNKESKAEELPETQEQTYERILLDLSEYGEQDLALYLINKHKNKAGFKSKLNSALDIDPRFSGFSKSVCANDIIYGFPQSDEKSIQGGCCYKDKGCNCTANLDIYYTWQFMQNETLKLVRTVPVKNGVVYATNKKILLEEGTTGTIYANDIAVQTFVSQKDGGIKFTKITNNSHPPKYFIEEGYLDDRKGELKLLWSEWPQSQSVICSYEYNYAENDKIYGFADDANSLMQGDLDGCGNLDIWYSSQYVQNDVISENDYICMHTPVLAGTMCGEIFLGDDRIQQFTVNSYNVFTFTYDVPSNYSVVRGEINNVTGVVTLTWTTTFPWENEPPVKPKVVVSYEYNLESPSIRTM